MTKLDPSLVPGAVFDNAELARIFGCGTQGGMRRAHKTNSLVLVSNHVESIYDDRWIDGVLHYTGMGSVSVSQFDRNPWVAEYTKRRADGHCDLCHEPAPFPGKDGTPYLENHHITWLSRGGEDSVLNTVALCPNCHRRMHVLDGDADKALLLKRIKMREAN